MSSEGLAGRASVPAAFGCCPVCGGTASAQVGREATAFDSVIGGHPFHQPAYSIRTCLTCDLYFKSHTLPLEQLDALNARLECDTYDIDGDFPTDRIVRAALERLPRGSRVLDFGCSTGRMLKGQTGRLACFGVEPNLEAATAARASGIAIVTETELRDGGIGELDAILLADVYEHLPRPLALLELLAGLLKPGGWLAVVTGNADAVGDRRRIGEFWYFRWPGHLHMLSERHLSWLATRLGLQVAALTRCSHYGLPVSERLRQTIGATAYRHFRDSPHSVASSLLRMMPGVRRAEHWPTAPALTYGRDHVVAILRKGVQATAGCNQS